MADQEVDAAAMAADADMLGRASADAVGAVDGLITAQRAADGFGSSPAGDAFREVCDLWLHGIDSIASHVDWLARYTQQVANAFHATDTTLAESYTPIRTEDDLPPIVIDETDPSSPHYNPYLA
jgi:uncharacterized protein YukE